MAPRHALNIALVLALLGATLAAGQAPVPTADYFSLAQGGVIDFSKQDLLANDQYSQPVELEFVSDPLHGVLTCAGDDCSYQPEELYAGEDVVRYRLLQGGSPTEAVAVRFRVVPQVLPLAGDWSGDGAVNLAWFWAPEPSFYFSSLEVFLEIEKAEVSTPVACSQGPGAEPGWLPVAGDWDGDGRQDIGLFDPVDRTFRLFVQGPASGWPPAGLPSWIAWETFSFPLTGQGGLPFAGDWDGDGADEVGLLLSGTGAVALAAAGGETIFAQFVIEVPGQPLEPAPWWPVAADWGGDGGGVSFVGLYDPFGRQLRMRLAHSDGPPDIVLGYQDEPKGMAPFASDFGHGESIGFYLPTGDGSFGGFVAYPFDAADYPEYPKGRRPINAPPPEDPLIDSCL